jgi:hypothetical protein
MTDGNTITVDIMHDDSSFVGAVKLRPATRFVQKAVATALRGLGLPLSSSISFRRQGRIVRSARLDFLLREHADRAVTT